MRKITTTLFALALLFSGCDKDSDGEVAPKNTDKTSGYVLYTQATTNYWRYFEDMPSGNVDNTTGSSFANFRTRMAGKNYILSSNISDKKAGGIDKIVVNSEGKFVKKASLPTIGVSYYGAIKDAETAFIDDTNDNDIMIFNPSTMAAKGKVDMSKAYREENWTNLIYESFIVRGNDMFVATRPYTKNNPLWAGKELIYNHIDLKTNTFVKSIKFPGAVTVRRTEQSYVDEQGNIYIPTQGNTSIPNIKPTILKIPAGSTDFDKSYNFKPIDKLSAAHAKMPIQVMGKFTYHKNGKAYANISTSFPLEIMKMFQTKPDFSKWTSEDFNKAFGILRKAANGQYVEIDLVAQTVKVIAGIPNTSPFDSYVNIIDGKVYCAALNTKESVNAMYEYDPATGTSKKAFDIAQGGRISGFYKLSK